MKKFKRISALLLAVIFALSVAACGSESTSTSSASTAAASQTETKSEAAAQTETKTETPAATEAPKEEAAATRTVTDMKGNEVEIPAEVNTYVESWFAHNAVDVMLDQAEGMLVTCAKPESYQWMYLVCPNMSNAVYTEFSDTMNVEEIISMNPDVVFGSNEDYRAMFENVGIPFINCSFSTYDTMKQSIALTAEVFGEDAQEIADRYFEYLDEKIEFVDEITSQIPEDERKYVAHGSSIYNMGIDGLNTIIDEWINLAGGINAAAKEIDGNLKEVTMEQLLAWDPDVIITGSAQDEVDSIMSDSAWAALTAVQNGEVYANPKGIFAWDRYGVEEALQFQWAAMTLYPDLFEGYDIETEVKNFYHDFLNYDLSDDQVAHIIAHEDPADDDEIVNGTASASAGARTITDFEGNVIELPDEVNKISTGKLNLTQLTLILGGSDAVANLGEGTDASKGTLFNAMFPELENLQVMTEDNMNTEDIIALDPDLIMLYVRSAELGETLKGVGQTVALCGLSDEEELLETMNMMATALGEDALKQAEKFEEFYRGLMADVAEQSASLSEDEKPTVMYIRNNGMVCGVNSMPNNWITAAGGINVGALAGFEQYAVEMSAEEIIGYDPEIIFAEGPKTLEFLAEDQYQNLQAVKNNAVYVVPYGLSCSGLANAENPLVWQWAANIINPDIYNYDSAQTIRDFFKDFYGYELSDDELSTVMHEDLNPEGAGLGTGETASAGVTTGEWTFIDQADNEVTVTLPIEKMVVLQHHSIDIICQLGGQDKIVGVEEKWSSNLGSYIADIWPEIEDMPTCGTLKDPNVEAVAALEPDVVIVASQANEDACQQLRDMGIPVVVVSLRGEGKQAEAQSPRLADADAAYTEGCEWAVKTLGKLTGRDEQAEELWEFCEESREMVDEAVGEIADEDRITAVAVFNNNSVYGNDKYVGCMLLRAGGINAAAADIQGNGEYSAENLAAWDPDYIITQDRYPEVYEMLTTDPAYAEIRAVKEGHVILAPYWTKPWGNPDADSMALGELWLTHIFYPEKVSAETVLERAEEFYERFYGVEFTGTLEVDAEALIAA